MALKSVKRRLLPRPAPATHSGDEKVMRLALKLARRGFGRTSPNPMVGAVLVSGRAVIGKGWHHLAGEAHAEINALLDAQRGPRTPIGGTLYVTLEPCCTRGRTPPCTDAIIRAGIRRVVVGATDPNPAHAGRGLEILRGAGIEVASGVLALEANELNSAFNHWIVHRTPFVTVKAGMSLDGKIATVSGESRWITGEASRAMGMRFRAGADAIVVGVNTIIADDPSLTIRLPGFGRKRWRRIILDPRARTPLAAKALADGECETVIVTTKAAPEGRAKALAKFATVLKAPERDGRIDLKWLLRKLGESEITSLLVEGGGETNASFLDSGLAHRVAFFYAPLAIGGRHAPKAVGGTGAQSISGAIKLLEPRWRKAGTDVLLTARVENGGAK